MEPRTKPTNIGMSHDLKMKGTENNVKSISIGTLANCNPSLNFPLFPFLIFFHSMFVVHIWYEVMLLTITRPYFVSEIWSLESICESVKCQQCYLWAAKRKRKPNEKRIIEEELRRKKKNALRKAWEKLNRIKIEHYFSVVSHLMGCWVVGVYFIFPFRRFSCSHSFALAVILFEWFNSVCAETDGNEKNRSVYWICCYYCEHFPDIQYVCIDVCVICAHCTCNGTWNRPHFHPWSHIFTIR